MNNCVVVNREVAETYKDFLKQYPKNADNNGVIINFAQKCDSFDKQSQNNKQKNTKRTVIIGASAAAAILIAAVLSKGKLPKSLEGIRNNWTQKTGKLGEIRKGLDNALPNSTNVKDAYFSKLWDWKIPGTKLQPFKWIDTSTSNLYMNLGKGRMEAKYAKTGKLYNELYDTLLKDLSSQRGNQEVDEVIALLSRGKKTMPQFINDFKNRFGNLNRNLDELDVPGVIRKRMRSNFPPKGENEKFKDILIRFKKGFIGTGKDFTGSFLGEDAIKGVKEQYIADLTKKRNTVLTNAEIAKITNVVEKFAPQHTIQLEKMKSSMGEAMSFEAGDLLGKLRDIKAGCAPTDFFDATVALGGLGLALTQADTKEKRANGLITIGLPAAVGMGVRLTAAAKMVNGSKALLLGISTGLITKFICDNLSRVNRKKNHAKERLQTH